MLKLELETDTRLSDALIERRVPLKMSCGGHGSCKTCHVVFDGKPELACQCLVKAGEYEVQVPLSKEQQSSIQMDKSVFDGLKEPLNARWKLLTLDLPPLSETPYCDQKRRLKEACLKSGLKDLEWTPGLFSQVTASELEGKVCLQIFDNTVIYCGREPREFYAMAVDLGTTTISCALIRLQSGEVCESIGRINAQYNYAEDVAARISYSKDAKRLAQMQKLVLKESFKPLLGECLRRADIKAERVLTTVVSGNTTMIHLLLGYDPTGLGGYPFVGMDDAPDPVSAAELGLPGKSVEFIPAKTAYVGGDIMSGAQYLDFLNLPEASLLVDMGTNAEMVLKAGGKTLCTAVPAGPSFEGGGLACGLSAIKGAVDRVDVDENGGLKAHVIGEGEIQGICGSGIISFIAAAFRGGILKPSGRYIRKHPDIEEREILGKNLRVYAFNEDVYVSEDDISKFLQAKAAIFSGICTLCRVAGIEPSNIQTLYLAGNFGRYISVADVIDIGILPDMPREKVDVVGNLSLHGALQACRDRDFWARADSLIASMDFVELNSEESFQNDFINALFIPNYDTSLFPSVDADKSKLARREQRRKRRAEKATT